MGREREYLADALTKQHPALIATSLSTFATCYHTRGCVALLEGQQSGWFDVQAGYLANLYTLRFEMIAARSPAWSQGRAFHRSTELAITLAFSRLFRRTEDRTWLEQAIEEQGEIATRIADGQSGGPLLMAMTAPTIQYTRDELLADRRACCRTRDAFPKRPTEIVPVGVLDLEVILHFPTDAAFSYDIGTFAPVDDRQIADCIAAYHAWYG